MTNTNTSVRHTYGDAETSNRIFAANLISTVTEQTALRHGIGQSAARVAGLAIGGMIVAGLTVGPTLVNAAIHLATMIW